MLDLLKKTLAEAPVVKKGEYHYVIHPITDGIPHVDRQLLEEVTDEMQRRIETTTNGVEKIVTMEAMGIPLASVLSLKTGLPFTIIRKRKYGLPGEVSVEQVTGYSKSNMFINGLNKDGDVVIVDDVLSTGGTLRAVLSALKKMEVNVQGVFIAVDKGGCATEISDEFGIPIDVLVKITVRDGNVVVE